MFCLVFVHTGVQISIFKFAFNFVHH